ncbi:MAG: hypothetical protein M3Y23_01240 [Actinomycetota bacterium]|nr:hypothetical protein [Actinomycetota bacterium]
MPELESGQRVTRDRFESAIVAASPLFDLVLAVGERISRIAEPQDFEYYPIRDDEPESEPPPSR